MARDSTFRADPFRVPNVGPALTCFLCDAELAINATRCDRCHAPIAMTWCAANGGRSPTPPKVLAAFGTAGSGKTVFLSMLIDILSRQRDRTELVPCGDGKAASQHATIAALAEQRFPSPTSRDLQHWRWAHCRVSRRVRRDPHEIFMVDVAGTAIINELDTGQPSPLIHGLCAHSFGFFLCVDLEEVLRGEKNQEFYAVRLINHINRVRMHASDQITNDRSNRYWRAVTSPPLAIVMTKSDQCQAVFDDPAGFVEHHMPNLWKSACRSANPTEFFPVSAVGQVAIRERVSGMKSLVPLRVEPQGITPSFRWLLGHSRAT